MTRWPAFIVDCPHCDLRIGITPECFAGIDWRPADDSSRRYRFQLRERTDIERALQRHTHPLDCSTLPVVTIGCPHCRRPVQVALAVMLAPALPLDSELVGQREVVYETDDSDAPVIEDAEPDTI